MRRYPGRTAVAVAVLCRARERRQRERQALRGSLRAVASTAGDCEAREVEYCQRWFCETGGSPTPARRSPDSAVSERVRGLHSAWSEGVAETRAHGVQARAFKRAAAARYA